MNVTVSSEAERQRLMQLVAEKNMHEYMLVVNRLVEKCFTDCVTTFSSRKLTGKEQTCVLTCTDKFMASLARMNQRYTEQNILRADSAGALPGSTPDDEA
eukprot:c22078_g1_i1.p2 GENE.c22078_g1_i1~~c22078_g1_i1.p2  ORF type:complete len:115 (+),score=32.81 c22078_g1_i1:47-346(+)